MSKLKELWSYAVFRWCVYVTPLLVFGLLLRGGVFDIYRVVPEISDWKPVREGFYEKAWSPYEIWNWSLRDYSSWIWILIFTLPAIWVWRKPLMRLGSFLNRAADDDSK